MPGRGLTAMKENNKVYQSVNRQRRKIDMNLRQSMKVTQGNGKFRRKSITEEFKQSDIIINSPSSPSTSFYD
jgi:hypothetical protein